MLPANRRLVLCVLVLGLILSQFSIGYVFAQENKPNQKPTKVKEIKLKPKEDAEIIIPDFTLTVYDDGSREVSASAMVAPEEPGLAYSFEVDTRDNTYKTKREAIKNPNDSSRKKATVISPGDYRATATIITTDIATIYVNSTRDQVEWRVDYLGKVYWLSVLDECMAANPSAAGTHWFIQSCSNDIPYYRNNQQKVYNDARGSYINWDFGSASQSTSVSHWISLRGQNDGWYQVSWSHTDSGEFAYLISGSLNSCRC